MDDRAGPSVLCLCTGGGGRNQESSVAFAQGNGADHRNGARLRAGNGDLPVDRGRGPGVGRETLDGAGGVMSKKWYVVHAYSGFEKSVQRALVKRIGRAGMEDKFGQIMVPVEEVVEMKSGQKNISERKFFPGYVLVEMDMTDETWHLVKNTPKVTGFVGGAPGRRPPPISEKEVQAILHQIQEGVEKPKPKVLFEVGEAVRVKEGPFTDFHGTVEDVNYDKSKLRVSVTIFGGETRSFGRSFVDVSFGPV